MTMMVNPDTGERVVCEAWLSNAGIPMGQDSRRACVELHKKVGFDVVGEL